MAVKLLELGTRRFIGDAETKIVHDRWNPSCEGCSLESLVERGVAQGFIPDHSDQAFWEDYEYCTSCFDLSDPEPPPWAEARPDDVPPSLRPSPLSPRGPFLSAGDAVSMEREAAAEGEAK